MRAGADVIYSPSFALGSAPVFNMHSTSAIVGRRFTLPAGYRFKAWVGASGMKLDLQKCLGTDIETGWTWWNCRATFDNYAEAGEWLAAHDLI